MSLTISDSVATLSVQSIAEVPAQFRALVKEQPMRVTAITHRSNAIVASYISQVTPSESSAIKRVCLLPP